MSRSKVAYVIAFTSIEQRDTFVGLVLHKDDDPMMQEAMMETKRNYKEEAIITYQEEDIKWYPDYGHVRAHTRMMHWANELFDAQYRLVRVGGGYDDVEIIQSDESNEMELWDYIEPYSSIRIGFPAE